MIKWVLDRGHSQEWANDKSPETEVGDGIAQGGESVVVRA